MEGSGDYIHALRKGLRLTKKKKRSKIRGGRINTERQRPEKGYKIKGRLGLREEKVT